MTLLPGPRLVAAIAILTAASFVVLVFPMIWVPLVLANVLVAIAALIDWLITPGPAVLGFERLVADRLAVFADHPVALLLTNRSGTDLKVRLRDGIPPVLRVATTEQAGTVPARGETTLRYVIHPLSRGRFDWGEPVARYQSLLGFWERQRTFPATGEGRVYPNMSELHRYHLLARADQLQAMGIRPIRTRGGAWEFESLREYVTGDDIRQIDWKATARRRKLIVRNRQVEKHQTLLLLLDCGRLMTAEVDGAAKLDHALNAALVLSHIALSRGDQVGLCTFSSKVHAWVPPRQRLAQSRLLMETVYDLRGDFTETDHGRCLRLVKSRFPKRALLIVLTDFVDATTAQDMLVNLEMAARRHLVLFIAVKDPFLTRAARSRPNQPLTAYRKSAAIDLLHERREVLGRMRQLGIHVLDAEPAELTPPLINRYLEITARGLL